MAAFTSPWAVAASVAFACAVSEATASSGAVSAWPVAAMVSTVCAPAGRAAKPKSVASVTMRLMAGLLARQVSTSRGRPLLFQHELRPGQIPGGGDLEIILGTRDHLHPHSRMLGDHRIIGEFRLRRAHHGM